MRGSTDTLKPVTRFAFWAAIWDPSALVQFLEALEQRGVPTRMDWVPGE